MYEVELKLRWADHDGLRARLRDLGAEDGGTQVESDTYYAHPVRDFAATDEALRVRRTPGRQELTYKGPRQDAAAKVRREENVAFDGDLDAVLDALGFRAVATLEKHRETWRLDGAVVSLDDVAGVGRFVEIEVVSADHDRALAQVETIAARLGLEDAPHVEASYLELSLQ